ncbi:MAG: cbb3-type cytochrome oxidase assembly protein CcoS [Gammaproteobacteria bacterium]
MDIIFVLIPLGLVLLAFAIWAFFWAVGNGQFDDLETPAWRILMDDDRRPPPPQSEDPETLDPGRTDER